jgi:hypothetical protein
VDRIFGHKKSEKEIITKRFRVTLEIKEDDLAMSSRVEPGKSFGSEN